MILGHWVSQTVVFTMILEQWVSTIVVFTIFYHARFKKRCFYYDFGMLDYKLLHELGHACHLFHQSLGTPAWTDFELIWECLEFTDYGFPVF